MLSIEDTAPIPRRHQTIPGISSVRNAGRAVIYFTPIPSTRMKIHYAISR